MAYWYRSAGGQNGRLPRRAKRNSGEAFGFALIFFATFLHQGKKVEREKSQALA